MHGHHDVDLAERGNVFAAQFPLEGHFMERSHELVAALHVLEAPCPAPPMPEAGCSSRALASAA